jgi:hypothetical protein
LTTQGRVDINNGPYGADVLRLYSVPEYGYSEICDVYGSLIINSRETQLTGGLLVNGSLFLQGSNFNTYSTEIILNNSPIKSNQYIIVANPRPASASNGDIVANRFVAFTNTSKVGITTTINIGTGILEITGGIITGWTPF